MSPGMQLRLRDRLLDTSGAPLVMGILNVTPDSFSDGGDHPTAQDAEARARAMIREGADIIDVGPESTRPGSAPVSAKEQIRRAVPVIRAIRAADGRIAISIDTRLASVAEAALYAGADMVNDVSALGDDPGLLDVVVASNAAVVLMHRQGIPANMQDGGGPRYDDLLGEICAFLAERRDYAVSRGIDASRIVVDPGIGFGKRVEHNLTILRRLDRFVAIGQPVLIGASRKSFIGSVLGIEEPKNREAGSLACAVIAAMAGAAILRVHEVRPAVEAVRLCAAVRGSGTSPPAP